MPRNSRFAMNANGAGRASRPGRARRGSWCGWAPAPPARRDVLAPAHEERDAGGRRKRRVITPPTFQVRSDVLRRRHGEDRRRGDHEPRGRRAARTACRAPRASRAAAAARRRPRRGAGTAATPPAAAPHPGRARSSRARGDAADLAARGLRHGVRRREHDVVHRRADQVDREVVDALLHPHPALAASALARLGEHHDALGAARRVHLPNTATQPRRTPGMSPTASSSS